MPSFEEQTALKTEAERVVAARVGQDIFRRALMEYWNGACPSPAAPTRTTPRLTHHPLVRMRGRRPSTERLQRLAHILTLGRHIPCRLIFTGDARNRNLDFVVIDYRISLKQGGVSIANQFTSPAQKAGIFFEKKIIEARGYSRVLDIVTAFDSHPDPLMTPADAAVFLRVHPKTVIRLARQRVLPALRLGKHWRFRAEDLTFWAAAQVESPCQPNE